MDRQDLCADPGVGARSTADFEAAHPDVQAEFEKGRNAEIMRDALDHLEGRSKRTETFWRLPTPRQKRTRIGSTNEIGRALGQ